VVVVDVVAELVRVREVHLARRGEVVGRVQLPRLLLVHVREVQEPAPLLPRECPLARRDGGSRGHGPVAREDAASQKLRIPGIDHELAVAVQEALRDAIVERRDQIFELADLDDALQRPAGNEPEGHGVDDAEQTVAADHEAKEVSVVLAAAAAKAALAVHERQGLDVLDDRCEREAAAVHVRG